MNRYDRQNDIVRTMHRNGHTTAESLAEKFDVSTRTIYRDIEALKQQGVPVVGAAGVGYRLGAGTLFDGVDISADELGALQLALGFAARASDDRTAETMLELRRKLNAATPEPLVMALTRIRPPAPAPRTDDRTIDLEELIEMRKAQAEATPIELLLPMTQLPLSLDRDRFSA